MFLSGEVGLGYLAVIKHSFGEPTNDKTETDLGICFVRSKRNNTFFSLYRADTQTPYRQNFLAFGCNTTVAVIDII